MNKALKFLLYTLIAFFILIAGLLLIPLENSPKSTEGTASGMACGGFAGIKCPLGFECVAPKAAYPDAMGTCRPGLNGETQQSLYSFGNKMKAGVLQAQTWVRGILWDISQKLNPVEPPPFGPENR